MAPGPPPAALPRSTELAQSALANRLALQVERQRSQLGELEAVLEADPVVVVAPPSDFRRDLEAVVDGDADALDQRQPFRCADQRAFLRQVTDRRVEAPVAQHQRAGRLGPDAHRAPRGAAAVDDAVELDRLAEAEAGPAVLFPDALERMAVAVGQLERQLEPGRQRMEQPHADPGLRGV